MLATNNTDSANITVMTNDGLGFFGGQLLIATGLDPQTPVVGRVDGGRMLDLVVANRDSNTTSVILNTTPPPPLCASDFNADGTVDPDDLADFVTAFFTVPPDVRTNVDGNGTVNPDDLADFINAFFTGCA